jgi:hypothetical protein
MKTVVLVNLVRVITDLCLVFRKLLHLYFLEGISKVLFHKNHNTSELDKGQKVFGVVLIADNMTKYDLLTV